MFDYDCPQCKGRVEAERFGDAADIRCPHCGAGPFRTNHDCHYDGEDEFCSDWLEPSDDTISALKEPKP